MKTAVVKTVVFSSKVNPKCDFAQEGNAAMVQFQSSPKSHFESLQHPLQQNCSGEF